MRWLWIVIMMVFRTPQTNAQILHNSKSYQLISNLPQR